MSMVEEVPLSSKERIVLVHMPPFSRKMMDHSMPGILRKCITMSTIMLKQPQSWSLKATLSCFIMTKVFKVIVCLFKVRWGRKDTWLVKISKTSTSNL